MTINQAVREQIKRKLDISFVLAKEHISFLKCPAIHDLEERHGVDLGTTYKKRDTVRNFVHYIDESQRQHLYTTSNLFRDIDKMLLRLYYLYEKSPKKSCDLSDFVGDLKEVYKLPEGGNLPVRASGSRWITHKQKALQQMVD